MDLVATFAGLAAFAAPASGTHVDCAQHVEPPPPAFLESNGDDLVWNARVGAAQLQVMTTGAGARTRMGDRRVWSWKVPVALSADADVLITVVGGRERFQHGRAQTFRGSSRTVRFTSCPADTPRFSGPGVVGPVTGWAGGLVTLDRRTCLRLRVTDLRAPGERAVALTVPLGRRSCD